MQYKLLISFSRLGTGTGGCNNKYIYCELFANNGHCTKEADFMEKLCCKACKRYVATSC